jgi:hypothetical protein
VFAKFTILSLHRTLLLRFASLAEATAAAITVTAIVEIALREAQQHAVVAVVAVSLRRTKVLLSSAVVEAAKEALYASLVSTNTRSAYRLLSSCRAASDTVVLLAVIVSYTRLAMTFTVCSNLMNVATRCCCCAHVLVSAAVKRLCP